MRPNSPLNPDTRPGSNRSRPGPEPGLLACAAIAAALLLWPSVAVPESAGAPAASEWRAETAMRGRFPARLRFQVISALEKADRRLQILPECGRLFSRLGADGGQALRSSAFALAASEHESAICRRRRAAAFTTVHGTVTHLCEVRFSKLTVEQAAVILLHEALHQAGMSEWPHDPEGLTSAEINLLVRRSCAL